MKAPSLLTLPVARATAPSNMSKAEPRVATMPPTSHHSSASMAAPATAMPKPMSVSMLGVRPARPMASARGSTAPRILDRVSDDTSDPLLIGSSSQAQQGMLDVVEAAQRLAGQAADDLAPSAARLDQAGCAQPA